MIPLRDVASHVLEAAQGFLILDAFGDHCEPEAMGHRERRLDDLHVVVAGGQVRDERPVDLQLLDREPLQVRKGRVPGSEVVDGQRYPGPR